MIEGRIQKFFQESCLLEQTYIKDPDKKVNDLITESIATCAHSSSWSELAPLIPIAPIKWPVSVLIGNPSANGTKKSTVATPGLGPNSPFSP